MRLRVAVPALVASVLLVAGCSTTVDGSGSTGSRPATSAASSAAPTAGATAAPTQSAPVPSAATPTDTATPGPSSSSSGTAAGGLDCPVGAITAQGAPFCYPLPAGFTDYSSLTNYGTGWTYKTLVSIGRHDLVEVLAARYPTTTGLTQAQLADQFDRSQRLKVGEYDVAKAGPVTAGRVAGARAFQQSAVYGSGVRTENTTLYLGGTIATVQCQSELYTSRVTAACARVRATLQLVGL